MLKPSHCIPQAFQMVLQFLRRQKMQIFVVLILARLDRNTECGLVRVFEILCLGSFVRIVVSWTGVLGYTVVTAPNTSNTHTSH